MEIKTNLFLTPAMLAFFRVKSGTPRPGRALLLPPAPAAETTDFVAF